MAHKIVTFFASISIALVFSIPTANAVEATQSHLETNAKESSLVVVLRIKYRYPFGGDEDEEFFRIKGEVLASLKGTAKVGDVLDIRINNSIHELATNCCDQGRAYVMFLKRVESRLATPLRTSSAVIPIYECSK